MIELRFTLRDVDYEAIIQSLAGHVSGPAALALAAARAMPDSAKEDMLVRYLNGNAGNLAAQLESAAQAKGIRLKVSAAQAAVVHE